MPFPRRLARRVAQLAPLAVVVAVLPATIASGDDGSWDLAHPSATVASTTTVGAAPGVVFDVLQETPVTVAGIEARFAADGILTVEVRLVEGAAPGDVVASASAAVTGGGDVRFHDVPLAFTFAPGQRYDVRFQLAGGWGFGPNRLAYQAFNNSLLDTRVPPAFVEGPLRVLDGGGGFASYAYSEAKFPHVHFVGAAVDADPPAVEVRVAAGEDVADSGWFNAASSGTDGVTVEVVATDDSPIAWLRCTDHGRVVLDVAAQAAATVELGDGFHSVTCTAEDVHGNTGSTSDPLVVRVDQTPPVLAPRVQPNPVYEGESAVAVPDAADALGVADEWCGAVTTREPGRHTVPCYADDRAGNRASAVAEYEVRYAFDGFFAPVRMGADNRVKAGATVPLKFSLDGFRGLDVLADGSPEVTRCDTGAGVGPAAGKLSYDGDDDLYVYVWKTDRAWAGGCYEVSVRLADGGAKSVRFSMT